MTLAIGVFRAKVLRFWKSRHFQMCIKFEPVSLVSALLSIIGSRMSSYQMSTSITGTRALA